MLSLELVKEHLRLDTDYCDEDALLLSYIKAAKRRVETYTRRTLITSDESVENKDTILQYGGDVEMSMLLLIGSWYANRESVVIGNAVNALPQAFEALLQPYVRYGI